jgi:hypothetical protein
MAGVGTRSFLELVFVGHLIVLGLIGLILTEAALVGIQKIPFTCSYQPGKSNFHLSFWAWVGFALALFAKGVALERQALQNITYYAAMVIVLSAIAFIARRRTTNALESKRVEFEDQPEPALNVLNLHEDGVPMIIPQAAGLADRS